MHGIHVGSEQKKRPREQAHYEDKKREGGLSLSRSREREKGRSETLEESVMQFVRSVAAQCYRQGKPLGRRDFSSSTRRSFHNGESKGMGNRTPEKPVVIRGSSAPGLALFFGFSGYMIWQMVENVRITKAMKKSTEYNKEARLRNTRVSEGYKELSRLIDEAKAEANK